MNNNVKDCPESIALWLRDNTPRNQVYENHAGFIVTFQTPQELLRTLHSGLLRNIIKQDELDDFLGKHKGELQDTAAKIIMFTYKNSGET